MALDEANALVTSLLDDEQDASRRARLVALQLALGWPHALEVKPEHLTELRNSQNGSLSVWRAKIWLGAASVLAFAWCSLGAMFWALMMWGDQTLVVMLAAFLLGLIHAAFGIVQAHRSGAPDSGTLRALSWMWLFGPAFSFAVCLGFGVDVLLPGLLCATPSMLVALAARHLSGTHRE